METSILKTSRIAQRLAEEVDQMGLEPFHKQAMSHVIGRYRNERLIGLHYSVAVPCWHEWPYGTQILQRGIANLQPDVTDSWKSASDLIKSRAGLDMREKLTMSRTKLYAEEDYEITSTKTPLCLGNFWVAELPDELVQLAIDDRWSANLTRMFSRRRLTDYYGDVYD